MNEEDGRYSFVYRLVLQAFRHISVDKIKECWNSENVSRVVADFLDIPEKQTLFFKESRGTIEVSEFPSKVNKVALFYVVKLEQESLSDQYIGKQIILGDLSSDPMENIAMMTEMVCHPIVESKGAAQIWS
jgi:hypothetical protein